MGNSYPKSTPLDFAAITTSPTFWQHAPHIVQGKFSKGFTIMPLYVFECNSCDKKLEVLQKYQDAWPDCPGCSKRMKKSVALTSFSLQGSGWAKDNYGLKSTG
jgi:putative FmdB family regulatory protein